MLPFEIKIYICSFLPSPKIRKFILFNLLNKNTEFANNLIMLYVKKLKMRSNLIYSVFNVYLHLNSINNFNNYITCKSNIYLLFNDETMKNKCIAYYLFNKLKVYIKNKSDKKKFINICKHILIIDYDFNYHYKYIKDDVNKII